MGGIGGTWIGAAKVINWLRQLNRSVLANPGEVVALMSFCFTSFHTIIILA